MKKTFKKLVVTAMLAVGVVSTSMVASAKSSAWIESPGYELGTTEKTTNDIATVTTDQTSITPDRITLKIRNFTALTSAFSSGTRNMKISVYDYDEYNADDEIKKYNGYIYSRVFWRIIEDTSYTLNDTIDAVGDNAAELYIEYYIPKLSGDPKEPLLNSNWFQYMYEAKSQS